MGKNKCEREKQSKNTFFFVWKEREFSSNSQTFGGLRSFGERSNKMVIEKVCHVCCCFVWILLRRFWNGPAEKQKKFSWFPRKRFCLFLSLRLLARHDDSSFGICSLCFPCGALSKLCCWRFRREQLS